MRRRTLTAALLALALTGLAGTPGLAAKGGGKGGGQPGGGDPPQTPAGVVYVHVAGDGYYAMDAAGANRARLFGESVDPQGSQADTQVAPSHGTHGGKRWFLVKRWIDELLADNNYRSELRAVSDAGDDVLIWSEAGARVYRRAWSKGDHFLSFVAAYPGSGSCELLRFDVDWSSGAPSIALADEEVVVSGTFDVRLPSMGAHSWSADGTVVAYTDRDIYSSPLTFEIRTRDTATGADTALVAGRHPDWAAGTAQVAYWRDDVNAGEVTGGVSMIDSDGTGEVDLTATGNTPRWSPDSAHLVLAQELTSGKGRKATTRQEVVRIAANGGPTIVLTDGLDGAATPLGWR